MFWGQVSHTETNHKELEEGHGGMQVPKSDWGGEKIGLEVEIQTDDQDELQSSGSKASHHMSSHVITVYACTLSSACQHYINLSKWEDQVASIKAELEAGKFFLVTLLIGSLVAVKEHAKSMCYAATLTESHKSDSWFLRVIIISKMLTLEFAQSLWFGLSVCWVLVCQLV